MIRILRLMVAVLGLSATVAFAQSATPPSTAAGPQPANILEASPAAQQAERQKTQPLNNAPMWREVSSGQAHYSSLPGPETGVLIQSGGEAWRQFRNGTVTVYGGWALVAVFLGIAAFYLWRGPIRVGEPMTGRMIERFTVVERATHWTNATCFVTLALTGLLMLFGKHVILPIFGYTLFSAFAIVAKTTHNFVGPLFAITTIALFLIFVRDNVPRVYDLGWLARGGGLLTGKHVPSHRFNAGEKLLFWGGVVLLGIIVATTGFILDFPNFEQTRAQMQQAWSWHVVAALMFVALIAGHIYIGTIGTDGAFDAMRTGYVDEAWAKEHHEYWYDDVRNGRIARHRSGEPVAPVAAIPKSES